MHLRLSQLSLVVAAAVFTTLVAFNNLTDYGSNYQYVQHVLSMDTTFPGNDGMWRSITSPALHHAAYAFIITVECVVAVLLWVGAVRLWRARADAAAFRRAKAAAIWGLTGGILLWFGGFMAVGGEWFLMWQSEAWNGQDESAMFATLFGIILLYLVHHESD
jgi:predicted small integral membrane protein